MYRYLGTTWSSRGSCFAWCLSWSNNTKVTDSKETANREHREHYLHVHVLTGKYLGTTLSSRGSLALPIRSKLGQGLNRETRIAPRPTVVVSCSLGSLHVPSSLLPHCFCCSVARDSSGVLPFAFVPIERGARCAHLPVPLP